VPNFQHELSLSLGGNYAKQDHLALDYPLV